MIDKQQIDIDYKNRIKKIVDISRLSLCTNENILKELCDKHQIDILGNEIERSLKTIKAADNDISKFDFTDMIYWPANYEHFKMDTYDFIFVDECQDLNKTQHKLIEKISHTNTRIIAVGDRNQAIYGFAGADTESFDNLLKIPNTITLPLSVNYRCGSNIINLAKNFVKQIEAHESTGEGVLNKNASIEEINDGDMILCRNTSPLVKLCLELLHKNQKAYVKGSDIGEDLNRLIIKSNAKTTDKLKEWLDFEIKKIIISIKKKYPYLTTEQIKEHNSFILFKEKHLLINTVISTENIKNTSDLIIKIRQIFLDNSTGICLSTIHKAKGLECKRVFIIDKEKTLPSKFAKLEWQKEQERNLEYVAYTRAKEYLGIITDWSFFKENEK